MILSVHTSLLLIALIALATGQTPIVPTLPKEGGRIVGGHTVTIQQYPYQLSFRVNGAHICGASIIHKNWALTAAHCCASAVSTMTLKSGSSCRRYFGTIHQVTEKKLHASYNPVTFDYDIALLKIGTSFSLSSSTQVIPLNSINMITPDGTSSDVTGWGRTATTGLLAMILPDFLQAVTVTVNRTDCVRAYPNLITDRMICAGHLAGGKDSCQGDSGGPLVANIDNQRKQIGVVSWGHGCGYLGYPGVYADVANLRDWISIQTLNAV